MILERKEGESETQYIWRIGQMIDAGQIDNWKSITPTLNKELRNDETEYRDESAYRKKYQYAKMFYDEIFSKRDNDEYIKELEEQKREIQKERIKLQDERANRNKNIRVEARVEQKLDYLEDVISKRLILKCEYIFIKFFHAVMSYLLCFFKQCRYLLGSHKIYDIIKFIVSLLCLNDMSLKRPDFTYSPLSRILFDT